MINGQPTPGMKAKSQWQRKLTAALMAGVLVWLPASPAVAAIVNSVTLTGTANGQPISASASASVDVVDAAPAMTIDKIGTLNDGGDGSADPGDTISYAFIVTNTGNVTLQNILLSDTEATLAPVAPLTLAPGAISPTYFSAVYTLTGAEIIAGSHSNTVTATAHSANNLQPTQNVSATDTESTPLNVLSSMQLLKTGVLNFGSNGRADAGDTITYSFRVTNSGPTQLHDVAVSDPLVNLAGLPGQDRMIALLDAQGQPSDPLNTATIPVGFTYSGNEHFAAADHFAQFYAAPHTIPQIQTGLSAQRRLVRMTGSEGGLVAGDKIGFVYALTNTGEGPLTAINVHQPKAEAYGETLALLNPNESDSANIIFTHTVTDEEAALGEVESPATITASSRGRVITAALNETIPLAGIATFDSFTAATISPTTVATLNAGQFTTFTATYTLTQADLDRGYVNNTATATAKNLADQTLTSVSSFNQTLAAVPEIAVIKTGQVDLGLDNVASVGDIVTYSFAITNTGNVTLNPVTIIDTNATVTGTAIANLLPGVTNTTAYSATHALIQADLDAGLVSNQATVRGTSPTGIIRNRLSDNDSLNQSDPTIVTLGPDPKIAILKTADAPFDVNNNRRVDAGDTITYRFAISNTGNQTLTGISVTDTKVPATPVPVTPAIPLASLAPGITNSSYFTAVYALTQADVDLGHVDNRALVEATAPGSIPVQDYSHPTSLIQDGDTQVTIAPQAAISLIKTSTITDTNGSTTNDAGDTITFAFRVENQGNVTLNNITITDPLPNIVGPIGTLAQLDPLTYDDTTFTATYVITPADVIAGRVTNRAEVNASPPVGVAVQDYSDNASPNGNNATVTAIQPLPAIALIKTIDAILDTNSNNIIDAGDTVTYKFSVKNTGNLPLNDVFIIDPIVAVAGPHISVLPAGNEDTTTFTASYIIQVTDQTAGFLSNQATAHGTPTARPEVTDDSDDNSYAENEPTLAYFTNSASIALVKTVDYIEDIQPNGVTDTNDIIHYKFKVTNTGNITLNTITLTDTNAVLAGGPLASLAPNALDQTTFTATHLITPADFLAGFVDNIASIEAYYPVAARAPLAQRSTALAAPPPGQGIVTDISDDASNASDGPTHVPLSTVPNIALIKKVKNIDDRNNNGITDVGDIIVYEFEVTNTGNADLTAVTLTDTNASVLPASGILAGLPLGTSNSTYFTAEHEITLPDALAGFVSNQAHVSANPTVGVPVEDDSDESALDGNDATLMPVSLPAPVFTKTANKNEVKRGEVVTYTITASNLSASSYLITDIMPAEFGYVAGSASVNGAAFAPVIDDRSLDFPALTPVSGKITIKLKLLASTTQAGGKFVNNATLTDPLTGFVVAKAQSIVTIAIEAVFDCSDITGLVFDDLNSNGYMDNGEPGLPGVRVVTLNGVLITTDAEGRYHVPCAAVPDSKIGSNYLLKLDTRSLPVGYKLTTENPRDVRVTKGKAVKLNFGAATGKATAPRAVKLDISDKAFDSSSVDLKTKWAAGLDKLMDVLAKKPSSLHIVYHTKGESAELVKARVSAVEETIIYAWTSVKRAYALSVTTSVEGGR